MVACSCPATTQFRSRVCPSTTVGDEDSILIGGETLGTGDGEEWATQPQSDVSDQCQDLTASPGTRSPDPLPSAVLTVGGVTALDGDDERGLLGAGTVTDMTHVLTRVCGCHLGDPKPGAHDLRRSRYQWVGAWPLHLSQTLAAPPWSPELCQWPF